MFYLPTTPGNDLGTYFNMSEQPNPSIQPFGHVDEFSQDISESHPNSVREIMRCHENQHNTLQYLEKQNWLQNPKNVNVRLY